MKALILSELRQRVRGKRWWILLLVWFLVLLGLTALVKNAAESAARFVPMPDDPVGPTMFGSLILFVLGLSSLVIPSLTSTSINAERDRGTLAVLQASMLRPIHIVGAKFIAAMIVALAFLVASLPVWLWAYARGNVDLGRSLIVYLLLTIVCALLVTIGLAASALVRKPSLSAVTAYLLVFLLTVGTPILFGLSLLGAREVGYERQIGWRWVILAPNPFVVVADAAPRSDERAITDPLEGIREAVRESRRPQRYIVDPETGQLVDPLTGELIAEGGRPAEPPALWPMGMAIHAALAGAAIYVTLRKLHVPARRLALGERVA